MVLQPCLKRVLSIFNMNSSYEFTIQVFDINPLTLSDNDPDQFP